MRAKRLFDLFFVIPGLLILSPALLAITFLIKRDSDGSVLFKQERVGLNGNIFKVLKFRTMVVNAEQQGTKITTGGDPRITKSGQWLRKYKLDELPQLLNVLKGEMSLVGPRPEVPEYVAFYTEEQKNIVHSVLPGITDNASIEFRNENEILEGSINPVKDYKEKILPIKIKFYEKYVRERSIWLDLNIIIRTFIAIIYH